MAKYTKEEVNYSRGMIHSHCGRCFPDDKGFCRHFRGEARISAKGTCEIVEGEILPTYWCKEFLKVKQ